MGLFIGCSTLTLLEAFGYFYDIIKVKNFSKNQTLILKNESSEFILSWVDYSSATRGYGDINENLFITNEI